MMRLLYREPMSPAPRLRAAGPVMDDLTPFMVFMIFYDF